MINFDFMVTTGITPNEYILLMAEVQKESEIAKNKVLGENGYKEACFGLIERGYLDKSNNITKEGRAFAHELGNASVTEEAVSIVKQAAEIYKENGIAVGNLAKAKRSCSWYMKETGFSKGAIVSAIGNFVLTKGKYTVRLDNLFWRQPGAYSTVMTLSESPLFESMCELYDLNKSFFVDKSKAKEFVYMRALCSLSEPPKKIDPSFTITGSAKGDSDAIGRAKKAIIDWSKRKNENG